MRIWLPVLFIIFSAFTVETPTHGKNWYKDDDCYAAWLGQGGTGTELDISGSEENLTVSGTVGNFDNSAPPRFRGKARVFDSASLDMLGCVDGSATDISGANQAISIATWVYRDSNPAGNEFFMSKYETISDERQYALYVDDSTETAAFYLDLLGNQLTDTVTYNIVLSTSVLTVGKWFHVCGVYDDATMKIYINGILENSEAYTAGILDGSAPFTWGSRKTRTTNLLGKVKEGIIFARALRPEEVYSIYYYGIDGNQGRHS